MLRKLLSVALMALGIGAGRGRAPGGGGQLRWWCLESMLPVPQECGGHIEYQLQRQTVLQNVPETVYETQQVPCVRTSARRSCSPGPSPPSGTSSSSASARCPTRSSGRSTGRSPREVHYTVQRPVTRTVWKDVHLHGLPAGARDAPRDPVVHRLPARSARPRSRRASTTSATPVREVSLQGRAATPSAGRSRRPSCKTVTYTVCRPVQETCYKTCAYTVCRPGAEDLLPVACPTRCRCRSSTP